jgi:hypothetical protein
MWFDSYYYLNICRDRELSENFNSTRLLNFLRSIPELQQVKEFEFRNVASFPFLQILILKAKHLNSWNADDTDSKETNLVTIVCSKSDAKDFEKIKVVLIKIASCLNWPLTDEQTEDGEENKILWTPQIN